MSIIHTLANISVYLEIFNNGIDESSVFDDLLRKEGAILTKKLSKGVNYIVYKEGRLKTVKYAMENNIPVVNPLWVHDKLQGVFERDEKYIIKRTFTELMIEGAKNRRRTKSPNEMRRRKNSSMFLSERRDDWNKENEEYRVVKSTIVNKTNCSQYGNVR